MFSVKFVYNRNDQATAQAATCPDTTYGHTMSHRSFSLIAALLALLLLVSTHPASGQSADRHLALGHSAAEPPPQTPQYLPGRLVVKLQEHSVFLKEQSRQSKQQKHLSPGQAGFQPHDNALEAVTHRLQTHGLMHMEPVFKEGAATRAETSGPGLLRALDPERTERARILAEGLERTLMVSYTSAQDPLELAAQMAAWPGVEYAEPHYVYHTTETYLPNDPLIGQEGHDYFEFQNFLRAWNVTQGSSDVVIAIVDSGVYYNHPDLIDKLWRNPAPGKADAYFPFEIANDSIGWNFWESGNIFAGQPPVQNANPIGNYSVHGTHVAGTAAASTDNGLGVAGTGFHSVFMPIKAGGTRDHPNSIAYGFQGILYAAINGAQVINCSFGGYGFSEFGQDVIDFATARGSLVVAAAGNDSSPSAFFPAGYNNVLSVGSVGGQGNRYTGAVSFFSNYGRHLDVFATGFDITSTWFDVPNYRITGEWETSYNRSTGTSMAAPVVSGLAALLFDMYPDWSPERVAAQIRSTASSLNEVNPQNRFRNNLGKGLIDAYAALTRPMPGIRFHSIVFDGADGEKINRGERGLVRVEGDNVGEPTSNLTATLETRFSGIEILQPSNTVGVIETGDSFVLEFEIEIGNDFSLDQVPDFLVRVEDNTSEYTDYSVFEYETLLFETVAVNDLQISISSDGTIGFMDAFAQDGGVGFIPGSHENILFEGGLLVAADLQRSPAETPTPIIINQIREKNEVQRHFKPTDNVRMYRPGELSDSDGLARFNSERHHTFKDLLITKQTYAFNEPGIEKAFFVRYEITNNSMATLNDLHVGLFNDWDLRDYARNHTGWSAPDSLLYVYDNPGDIYAAVTHMGAAASNFAIDNDSPWSLRDADNRADSLKFGIYYDPNRTHLDGFTRQEKRLALTAGNERTTISNTDISVVTSSGPFTMGPNATITVGFIYAWGESLPELRSQVAGARTLDLFETSVAGYHADFRELAEEITLFQNFPNPFNPQTYIEFHVPEAGHAELSVYNIMGQRVATLFEGTLQRPANMIPFDASGLASGVYIAVLRSGSRTATMKMTLVK